MHPIETEIRAKRVALKTLYDEREELARVHPSDLAAIARYDDKIKAGNMALVDTVERYEALKASGKPRQIDPLDDNEPGYRRGDGSRSPRSAFPDLVPAVMKAVERDTPSGMKSFIADGTAYVDVPVGGPVADPYRARFVEDLLPTENAPGGRFSYLRQTVRDNNAAVVATGAEKPVSRYELVLEEDGVDVIAHVSEPMPKYYFDNSPKLRQFITNELALGVRLATDAEILTDLLATSGILTEGDIGDVWETARRALTRLQERDIEPTAYVMHPRDWEQVEKELLAAFAGNANTAVPTDAFKRSLFGIPVVLSNALAIDTIVVGDFSQSALLYTTGGIAIEWSDGAGFTKNEVTWRGERRAKLAVTRPFAFCVVNATGTGS